MPTIEELVMQLVVAGVAEVYKAGDALDGVTEATGRLRDAQGRFVTQEARAADAVRTASAAATKHGSDVYELADAYELLGEEVTTVFTSASRVPRAFDWTKVVNPPVRKLTEDFNFAGIALGGIEGASGKAAKGTRDMGFAALQASRGIEDMQYGFAGVINNIPGVVMAMGGPAGLTAAISLAAVGVFQLGKHWSDLAGVFQNRNPVPGATTSLEGLEKALGKNKDALGKLRDETSLSNAQLAEFNRLTQEQIRLEDEVALRQKTKEEEKVAGREQKERGQRAADIEAEIGGPQMLADLQSALVKFQGSFGAEQDKKMAAALLQNFKAGQTAASEFVGQLVRGGFAGNSPLARNFEDPGGKAQHEADARFARQQEDARQAAAKKALDAEAKSKQDAQEAALREIAATGVIAPTPAAAPAPAAPEAPAKDARTLEQRRKDKLKQDAAGKAFEAEKLAARGGAEFEAPVPGFEANRAAVGFVPEGVQAPGEVPGAAPEAPAAAAPAKADPTLAELTRSLIAEARAQHLAPDRLYELVRDGIARAIAAGLAARGVKSDGEAVQTAAASLARKGIDDAEKDRAGQVAAGKPEIRRQVAAEDAGIKAGGHVELAEELMARVKDAGGATDRNGRFRRMDAGQQFDYVQQQVAQYLHRQTGVDRFGRPQRAGANLNQQQTVDLSTRITAEAGQNYQKRLGELSAQGLSAHEQTQAALVQTQAALAGLMTRLQKVEGNNRQLAANAARLQKAAAEHQPTALPFGGGN